MIGTPNTVRQFAISMRLLNEFIQLFRRCAPGKE